MSEIKLISPMLDGFLMGDPISEHNGVRCCPAMKNDSDDRYIVKIISNPATQTQLDALILSGAYPDAASAKTYYKQLADGITVGAEVEAGQLLGSVGDTAMIEIAEEPHLHVEMTVKGLQVDPLDYFSKEVLSALTEDSIYEGEADK